MKRAIIQTACKQFISQTKVLILAYKTNASMTSVTGQTFITKLNKLGKYVHMPWTINFI